MKIKPFLLSVAATLTLFSTQLTAKDLTIGMSIDDLRLERWQKDRDIFVKKAESMGL